MYSVLEILVLLACKIPNAVELMCLLLPLTSYSIDIPSPRPSSNSAPISDAQFSCISSLLIFS